MIFPIPELERRKNWKLFLLLSGWNFFSCINNFFSVIDWQKVESGFSLSSGAKYWNILFVSVGLSVRMLFRKSVLHPFWLTLPKNPGVNLVFLPAFFRCRARAKLADFATMKPEGWNIYKKLCKRRLGLRWSWTSKKWRKNTKLKIPSLSRSKGSD